MGKYIDALIYFVVFVALSYFLPQYVESPLTAFAIALFWPLFAAVAIILFLAQIFFVGTLYVIHFVVGLFG